MALSIINCSDPNEADVVLLGANYDVTSSFGKGASQGPAAIIDCLNTQVEFLDRHTGLIPRDHLKIAYHDLGDLNSLGPEEMVAKVGEAYRNHLGYERFNILLGGEHAVTNAALKEIGLRHFPSEITIVQLDAHFDLRDTDEDFNDAPWGKYSHACVMRRAAELGYKIVTVGVRAYSQEEFDFARQNSIAFFEWGRGQAPSHSEILKAITTEKVYLTIDADGFDPVHLPATGTPVPGGLEWNYALGLIGQIFKHKKVVGADVVEVSPRAGENLTEYGAAQICHSLMAGRLIQSHQIKDMNNDHNNLKRDSMFNSRSDSEIDFGDGLGPPVIGRSVEECDSLKDIFENALPAFGGAYLKRVYGILRAAVLNNVPLVISVAGPVTVSDQHRAWLIPLLETGWVAYLTTTDAVCYHDGHDALYPARAGDRPIKEVNLFGDDGAYRAAGIIRVADTGFKENVLFDQDRMISAVLARPEFQKRMTTTERNYLLGRYYEIQEHEAGVRPGFLSTCSRLGLPVFVGAPADGSAFLNSVKLWALNRLSNRPYWFDYDLHADVFESCAYHYWGLFDSEAQALGALILGGGVPKNYSLQPEPTLSQIFLLSDIRGYDYDVQIVSSPVTDGSLSSCFPAEAVSWGKINPQTYRTQTESMQADYSMVMPFIVKALLDDPTLPRRPQLGLYYRRQELVSRLFDVVAKNQTAIEETLNYPLKIITQA
ncbi:MAG: agmatinase [Candidatus Sungbacteria bacterium]|uniref:Agmatinase n=3 Tax=Candidatus Sungiibacteriota bacterium TaxID=2750080 RepID=A0A932DS93_9BACT|nr:agmatinase [Candidatus Sungbacteria bacterium]